MLSKLFPQDLSLKVLEVSPSIKVSEKHGGSSLVRYLLWTTKTTWVLLCFGICFLSFYLGTFLSKYSVRPEVQWSNVKGALLFAFWLSFFSLAIGAFDRAVRSDAVTVYRRLFVSWIFTIFLTLSTVLIFSYEKFSRLSLFFGALSTFFCLTVLLYLFLKKIRKNPYCVCFLGPNGDLTKQIKCELLKKSNCSFLHIDFDEQKSLSQTDTERVLDRLHEMGIRDLILSDRIDLSDSATNYSLFGIFAFRRGYYVRGEVNYYTRVFERYPLEHMKTREVFAEGFTRLNPLHSFFKRIFDFLFALTLMGLLSPLFLVLAILTKATSRGPVLFKQERVGRNGKLFTMYKFRSMRWSEERPDETLTQLKKSGSDDRITKFGLWMRRFHVDELPQVWNIFLGHMSFIGPRAEASQIIEKVKVEQPLIELRTIVRPGLSGMAQLSQGKTLFNTDEMTRKLSYDLFYIKNFSIGLDLWLIARTLFLLTKRTW